MEMVETDCKNVGKLYAKYKRFIIKMEGHIINLADNWVIDEKWKFTIIKKLDEIVRKASKIYADASEKQYKIGICGNELMNDPFKEVKYDLISLAYINGYPKMSSFVKLITGEPYEHVSNKSTQDIFKIYNNLFTPICIIINKEPTVENIREGIIIRKIQDKCDGLINNVCTVSVPVSRLLIKKDIIQKKTVIITFEGYVRNGPLNINTRMTDIANDLVNSTKCYSKRIILDKYPQVNTIFIEQYYRMMNDSMYFTYSPGELAEKIVRDYEYFLKIRAKKDNSIIREFVKGEIRDMHRIMCLLLMGDSQNISSAGLLFNLLGDKKASGENLKKIILKNMSYYLQIRLRKNLILQNNDISKIHDSIPGNVTIEKRLAAAVNMPRKVKEYILDKMSDLSSGENRGKANTAINGLFDIPWKAKDHQDKFANIDGSLCLTRECLDEIVEKFKKNIYGHNSSKSEIIDIAGRWVKNSGSSGQIIGLKGHPGVGKTRFAMCVAEAMGVPMTSICLGGMSDSASLIGHNYTYANAECGTIIKQLMKAGSWRFVLFLDEVDKTVEKNGIDAIQNVLIHLTDPLTNDKFHDLFYSTDVEFDLSGALIIFSYNSSEKFDPALKSRIKEITVNDYSTSDKIKISTDYIIPELCKESQIVSEKIRFTEENVEYIIDKYTAEPGVRRLKQCLEQIILKINTDRNYLLGPFREFINEHSPGAGGECRDIDTFMELVRSKNNYIEIGDIIGKKTLGEIYNMDSGFEVIITDTLINRYLGRPCVNEIITEQNNKIGVINGLYATDSGIGGVVPFQILEYHAGNTFKLKLTGYQKRVMQESAEWALSTSLNLLDPNILGDVREKFPRGIHIHAFDGGTPKDGPSAGTAIAVALISIFLGKPINNQIAVTGELSTSGEIKRIGSLDVKLKGAHRAGIKSVYICKGNEEDYQDFQKKEPKICEQMNVIIVNSVLDIVTDPNVIKGALKKYFKKVI
jgi:ATP-dependent Lon protease